MNGLTSPPLRGQGKEKRMIETQIQYYCRTSLWSGSFTEEQLRERDPHVVRVGRSYEAGQPAFIGALGAGTVPAVETVSPALLRVIRRRVEDTLRKRPGEIIRVAEMLGVSLAE